MTSIPATRQKVSIPFIFIFSVLLITLSSCARKMYFDPSTVEPAAIGTVHVKKDHNHNYSIEVEVKNLAPANRLPEPRNMYLVWIETTDNGIQNLGQLTTSSGLITSTLKAYMHTTTPYKPVRLFITAEDVATLTSPGNYTVLTTRPL